MHYPMSSISPSFYIEGCNISDSVRNALIFRLKNPKWPETAILSYVESKFKENIDEYDIDKKAKAISKNDSLFLVNKIKLTSAIKSKIRKNLASESIFKIDKNLLLTIAWLNLQSCKPFLRDTALFDTLHYDKTTVKLALSKLGESKYQKEFIEIEKRKTIYKLENHPFKEFNKSFKLMGFINSQESIFELNKWIDEFFIEEMNSNGAKGFLASTFVFDLNRIILNKDFNVLTKGGYLDEFNCKNDLQAIKKWIIDNKGKYILNQKLCTY